MGVIIRNESVYISCADILFVQIEHRDVRIILEHHAGDDLVADLYRISGAVNLYILTDLYNLSGSLMSQSNRDQAEGIFLEFMLIGSADSGSLDSYEDIIVADLRDRELLHIIVLKCCEHRHMRGLRNRTA